MNTTIRTLLANRLMRIIIFLIIFALPVAIIYSLISTEAGTNIHILLFLLFIATIIVESSRSNSKWYAVGLRFDKFAVKYIIIGLLLALGSMAMFIPVKLSAGYEFIGVTIPSVESLFQFTSLIFCYSVFEELMFRGVIFQTLLEKFNETLVTLVFSLFFAILHIFNTSFDLISFLNTFLAGILFSFMYIQTKSLWLPISLHFFWNFSQKLIADANISGNYYDISFINMKLSETNADIELFTGGYYGPESSVITIFLLILFIVITSRVPYSPYQNSILLKRKYAESELRHKN